MLANVALVAAPESDLRKVRAEISDPTRFLLREFLSMEEVRLRLALFRFDVLIARHREFGTAQLRSLEQLRKLFPNAPLVSLVKRFDPKIIYEARNITEHKIIYEDSELGDLGHVVEKLKRRELSGLRLHPRAARAGDAEVLVMNADGSQVLAKWKARFIDFSRMGARFSLQGEGRVQQGCRAQLHYQSSVDSSRKHRIETKVVWGKESQPNQEQTVALRFIAAL